MGKRREEPRGYSYKSDNLDFVECLRTTLGLCPLRDSCERKAKRVAGPRVYNIHDANREGSHDLGNGNYWRRSRKVYS
jgi:hypothetical protein